MKNRRSLELDTSLSLGGKTYLGKLVLIIDNFDNLMQSSVSFMPKITFDNLCRPINDVIIIPSFI